MSLLINFYAFICHKMAIMWPHSFLFSPSCQKNSGLCLLPIFYNAFNLDVGNLFPSFPSEVTSVLHYAQIYSANCVQAINHSKHFRNNQGTDLSGIISHFPKWKTRYTTSHIVFFLNQVTGTFSPFNFWTGKGLSILNHILQVRLLNSMSLRSFISTKTLSAKPENLRGRGDAVNPSTHRAGI